MNNETNSNNYRASLLSHHTLVMMPSNSTPSDSTALALKRVAFMADAGFDQIKRAAEMLCRLLDKGTPIEAIACDAPELTPEKLRELIRVGRGQLLSELFVFSCPGYERLKLMPLDTQKRYLTEPVELEIELPDGSRAVEKICVEELTEDQARKAFRLSGEE